jgi:hypothetical protein
MNIVKKIADSGDESSVDSEKDISSDPINTLVVEMT